MMRLVLAGLVAFTISINANAQEKPKDMSLAEQGWREVLFDNKAPNNYFTHDDGSISVGTNESVSLIYKEVEVDLSKTPKLSWSWKVDVAIPPTDLRIKGKDDRSLAIYVSFPFDYERANFFERFFYKLVAAIKGEETPGRVISYVWGGDAQRGTISESPYLKSAGALITLREAKASGGEWFNETVDVVRDYERIFGEPPNQPYQIAISADSDDTKLPSLGWVRDIRFE
jgi:hypothetical protein